MRRIFLVGATLAALLAPAACTTGSSDGDGRAESAWGTLNDDTLVPDSPQFLINKPRGATYRVCLPQYMADRLPGVASEVEAAINVWASYLGRTIPVDVETKDLPRATADQTIDQLADAYQAACGSGFDVVMGFAKLEGVNVGLTGVSYSYFPRPDGSKQITSFRRFLFLRDYDLLPSADDEGEPEGWTSLEAVDGHATSASDLLARMLARSDTRYVTNNSYFALPVLTHEFGHVWGLCDQYEGSTNCDPRFGTEHLVEGSVMGARGETARLYLTDDDIDGIRALAARPGFDHDWGPATAAPPAPIVDKPVDLARIEDVRRKTGPDGTTVEVKYGIVTSLPAKYTFELSTDGVTFTPLTSGFQSAQPIDTPVARLDIAVAAPSPRPYQVRMHVIPDGADPATAVGGEP